MQVIQPASIVARGALLGGTAVIALVLWSAARAQAGATAQAIDVSVVEPTRRDIELTSTQPGTAKAFYEADLGAKVSGYVSELLVDIGTRVTKGQVLARIAVPELIQAEAAAAADARALQSEYDRVKELVARNSVTQKTLTETKNRLDAGVAKQAQIQAELAYATIEAPFDGVITSRSIDPGDMVFEASSPKGSGDALLRVAALDVIRVETYVPERDAAWADVGDPATVAFDALPGKPFAGKVSRMSGALDPATRTMLVEIDLPNPDGLIKPGYYGRTRIVLESRKQVLALPDATVHDEQGNAYVYVVAGESEAQRTLIHVGVDDGEWAEIASGLDGNQRVIAAPAAVADGAPVRIAQ